MRYMGSKVRLSKELAPIIQSYIDETNAIGYIEPFVGGANMIDKIKCKKRYGFDTHRYLIALLQKAQTDISDFPNIITEELYNKVKNNKDNYEDWFVGLIGFCSFGSKWFGGFRRSYNKDGMTKEETAGVINNLKKTSSESKGYHFPLS